MEHDEEIIRAADKIVDIGPEAGVNGGTVVAEGNFKELLQSNSLTAKYLNQDLKCAARKTQNLHGTPKYSWSA